MERPSTEMPRATLCAWMAWLDPIEEGVPDRMRGFSEGLLEEQFTAVLGRAHFRQMGAGTGDYRHGLRQWWLIGAFGPADITAPRALIAATWLAGRSTRRVRLAPGPLSKRAGGKGVVSRTKRKVEPDCDVWNRHRLADDNIVRLVLDDTVVGVWIDRKATRISLLVVLGIRRGGQKVLLAVKNMRRRRRGSLARCARRSDRPRLPPPESQLIGGAGVEHALAGPWPNVSTQRRPVHKHPNLLAHAPEVLHEEITADYYEMTYAETDEDVARHPRLFLAKWQPKCPAAATILEGAIHHLFTFTSPPKSQWKTAWATDAIERLNGVQTSDQDPDRFCLPPKPPPCSSGFCWALARSPRAR